MFPFLTHPLPPRFRAKVIELEEELSRVKQELATAKSEAAAAKADNVALVERLRWAEKCRPRCLHVYEHVSTCC